MLVTRPQLKGSKFSLSSSLVLFLSILGTMQPLAWGQTHTPQAQFIEQSPQVLETIDRIPTRRENYLANARPRVRDANAAAVAFASFQPPAMASWASMEQVNQAFIYARDLKFLDWSAPNGTPFPRRSTWLFPDNGCFARSDLMVRNLQKMNYPEMKKVFSFGPGKLTKYAKLGAMTKNHPLGVVAWRYHTAPVVRLGEEYFVLDPSLSFDKPLPLAEWVALQHKTPDQVRVSFCSMGTYNVGAGACKAATPVKLTTVLNEQIKYLAKEWDRLLVLGRDPYAELK